MVVLEGQLYHPKFKVRSNEDTSVMILFHHFKLLMKIQIGDASYPTVYTKVPVLQSILQMQWLDMIVNSLPPYHYSLNTIKLLFLLLMSLLFAANTLPTPSEVVSGRSV